ncbi:MAG: cellulase family glycosylhydrolase [Candidatus Omnitrophica bacterium]|nr:cellulase family glycosylhydrolase [Candidatus Omnitrophota bacterium]
MKRDNIFLRVVSIILVITFLNLEFAWAYPTNDPNATQNHSTIAVPYLSSDLMKQLGLGEIQQTALSDANLMYSALNIGSYLLERQDRSARKTLLDYVTPVMTEELGSAAKDIVLKGVSFKNGENRIVLIPCTIGGEECVAQIALKSETDRKELIGRAIEVSDRFILSVVTKSDIDAAPAKKIEESVIAKAEGRRPSDVTAEKHPVIAQIDLSKANVSARAEGQEKPSWLVTGKVIIKIFSVVLLVVGAFLRTFVGGISGIPSSAEAANFSQQTAAVSSFECFDYLVAVILAFILLRTFFKTIGKLKLHAVVAMAKEQVEGARDRRGVVRSIFIFVVALLVGIFSAEPSPKTGFVSIGNAVQAGDDLLLSPAKVFAASSRELTFNVKTGDEVSAFLSGDFKGYMLEIKFKNGKSAKIQPWFKNSSWQNLYAFPMIPDGAGIVRFDPAKDNCNVCDFKKLNDVAEVGFKVWGGSSESVLGMIEYARLVPAGMKAISPRPSRAQAASTDFARAQSRETKQGVSIPPDKFVVKGSELYLDVRNGVLAGLQVENGVDLTGYIMEIVLKSGQSVKAQLYFKNNAWNNVYSFPATPKNGVIRFDPATDKKNVNDFSDFSNIYAIGVKIFGESAEMARKKIKEIRLVPIGTKRASGAAVSAGEVVAEQVADMGARISDFIFRPAHSADQPVGGATAKAIPLTFSADDSNRLVAQFSGSFEGRALQVKFKPGANPWVRISLYGVGMNFMAAHPDRNGIVSFDPARDGCYDKCGDLSHVDGIVLEVGSDMGDKEVTAKDVLDMIESAYVVPQERDILVTNPNGQSATTDSLRTVKDVRWDESTSSWAITIDVFQNRDRDMDRGGAVLFNANWAKYAGKEVPIGFYIGKNFVPNGYDVHFVRIDNEGNIVERLNDVGINWTGDRLGGIWTNPMLTCPQGDTHNVRLCVVFDCFNAPIDNKAALRVRIGEVKPGQEAAVVNEEPIVQNQIKNVFERMKNRIVEFFSNIWQRIKGVFGKKPQSTAVCVAKRAVGQGLDLLLPNSAMAAGRQELNFSVKTGEEVSAFVNGNFKGYVLEIKFKSGKSARIQPWFKNSSWQNVYAFPQSPDSDGIVRFDPKKDSCNVCDFKDLNDVAEIGFKVWGSSPESVLKMIEYARLVPAGQKSAPVQNKPVQKTESPRKAASEKPLAWAVAPVMPAVKATTASSSVQIPLEGWKTQTWQDSQAVDSLTYAQGEITFSAKLVDGKSSTNSKGEIFIDLSNSPSTSGQQMDLRGKKISVWVYVPEGFVRGTDPQKPNGIQLFLKDNSWKNQYSTWHNVSKPGWMKIEFSPVENGCPPLGYTDPGVELSNVRLLGVKIGVGGGSSYKGNNLVFKAKDVRVEKAATGKVKAANPLDLMWTVQDYVDSQAVKGAKRTPNGIEMDVKIDGNSPNNSKGELYLDLDSIQLPGMSKGPQDLSGSQVKLRIKVPRKMVSRPFNGVQIFCKSVKNGKWSSQYGKWQNIAQDGVMEVVYTPTLRDQDPQAWCEEGFDPTNIRMLGIKVAAGGGSTTVYEGPITIESFEVTKITLPKDVPPLKTTPQTRIEARKPVLKTVPMPVSGFKEYCGVSLYYSAPTYGRDLGGVNGFSKREAELTGWFEKLKSQGINLVRIFTFCDLRNGAIQFDGNGKPIGFDKNALEDFKALIRAANKAGVKIIPVLFDFTLADGAERESDTGTVGEHTNLLRNEEHRQALVNIFRGFLRELKTYMATNGYDNTVLAFEPMNEPELTNIKSLPATLPYTQQFVTDFVNLFREVFPGKPISLSTYNKQLRNWLHLLRAGDIMQIHWYKNLGDEMINQPLGELNIPEGVRVIFGEVDPTADITKVMTTIHKNGYGGVLFWHDGNFNFLNSPERLKQYQRWFEQTRKLSYWEDKTQEMNEMVASLEGFKALEYSHRPVPGSVTDIRMKGLRTKIDALLADADQVRRRVETCLKGSVTTRGTRRAVGQWMADARQTQKEIDTLNNEIYPVIQDPQRDTKERSLAEIFPVTPYDRAVAYAKNAVRNVANFGETVMASAATPRSVGTLTLLIVGLAPSIAHSSENGQISNGFDLLAWLSQPTFLNTIGLLLAGLGCTLLMAKIMAKIKNNRKYTDKMVMRIFDARDGKDEALFLEALDYLRAYQQGRDPNVVVMEFLFKNRKTGLKFDKHYCLSRDGAIPELLDNAITSFVSIVHERWGQQNPSVAGQGGQSMPSAGGRLTGILAPLAIGAAVWGARGVALADDELVSSAFERFLDKAYLGALLLIGAFALASYVYRSIKGYIARKQTQKEMEKTNAVSELIRGMYDLENRTLLDDVVDQLEGMKYGSIDNGKEDALDPTDKQIEDLVLSIIAVQGYGWRIDDGSLHPVVKFFIGEVKKELAVRKENQKYTDEIVRKVFDAVNGKDDAFFGEALRYVEKYKEEASPAALVSEFLLENQDSENKFDVDYCLEKHCLSPDDENDPLFVAIHQFRDIVLEIFKEIEKQAQAERTAEMQNLEDFLILGENGVITGEIPTSLIETARRAVTENAIKEMLVQGDAGDPAMKQPPVENKQVKELFDIVEAQINDRRVRFISAGNAIVRFLKMMEQKSFGIKDDTETEMNLYCAGAEIVSLLGDMDNLREIDEKTNTAELIQHLIVITDAIEKIQKSDKKIFETWKIAIPENVTEAITLLSEGNKRVRNYENIRQLEVDSVIASLIIRARALKRSGGRNLTIALEMDWMPGADDRRSLQNQASALLVNGLDKFETILNNLGLDNVVVVRKERDESLDQWIQKMIERGKINDLTDLSGVFALGSEGNVKYVNDRLAGNVTENSKRPFLVGIDPSLLVEGYEEAKGNIGNMQTVLDAQTYEILYVSLELANGRYMVTNSFIEQYGLRYERNEQWAHFKPQKLEVNYEELRFLNDLRRRYIDDAA